MNIIHNIKHITLAAITLIGTASCEKDLEPYSNPDCYLNFLFKTAYEDDYATTDDINTGYAVTDQATIYNFKFHNDRTSDTVWVEAQTMGFVTDYDRQFALEQVMMEGEENAVAGVDYVAFDSEEAQRAMVVKAGETKFKVPVIVKRSELQRTKTVMLKIRFKANDYFRNGFDCMQERIIAITDRLAKPSVWDDFDLDFFLGYYGEVKHKLMIEWSGNTWDDEYITEVYNTDNAYIDYMDQVFAKRLAEENEKRKAQGLDVYREADGTEVDFTPASWW